MLGEQIKTLRTANKLSQVDLAKELGVFCKTFLQKVAKHFCRLLQLHFVGSCNNCSFLLNVSNANIFFIIQINIVILLSA